MPSPERGDNMILLAEARPTRRDDQIVVKGGGLQCIANGIAIVGKDAFETHMGCERRKQTRKHGAVGVVDPSFLERRPRLKHFVSCREHTDARLSEADHIPMAARGESSDILGAEAMAGLKDRRAFRHIFSGKPAVRAPLQAARNEDGSAALDAAVFLNGDGVAPKGHCRASENANRLPSRHYPLQWLACCRTARDLENRPFAYVVIFEGEGIAIDGGVRMGRDCARGVYGFCTDASSGSEDTCRCLFRYWNNEPSQKSKGFLMEEPALRKCETIVGSGHV